MIEVYMDLEGKLFTCYGPIYDFQGRAWYPMTDDVGTILVADLYLKYKCLGEL
jgi:hypothetical protein